MWTVDRVSVIVTVFCLCIHGETTFNSVDGKINSSDHQVVRACASGAVDSSLIPSRVKPMALNVVFTASLLDVSALKRQCVEQAGKLACCAIGKGT